MARRNHLGHRLIEIKVPLDPAPSTTVYAHGLDVTKIIYFHWYVSDAGDDLTQTAYNVLLGSQSTVSASSVKMDATNFTIDISAAATNTFNCTFNIILED
jgi:hypothetical protein